MKSVFLSCLLLFIFSTGLSQVAKQERKFWKKKSKMYVKNPISLKSEFENFQEQIKDLKTRNKALIEQSSGMKDSEYVDSLMWVLVQSEGLAEALRRENESLKVEHEAWQKNLGEIRVSKPYIDSLEWRILQLEGELNAAKAQEKPDVQEKSTPVKYYSTYPDFSEIFPQQLISVYSEKNLSSLIATTESVLNRSRYQVTFLDLSPPRLIATKAVTSQIKDVVYIWFERDYYDSDAIVRTFLDHKRIVKIKRNQQSFYRLVEQSKIESESTITSLRKSLIDNYMKMFQEEKASNFIDN